MVSEKEVGHRSQRHIRECRQPPQISPAIIIITVNLTLFLRFKSTTPTTTYQSNHSNQTLWNRRNQPKRGWETKRQTPMLLPVGAQTEEGPAAVRVPETRRGRGVEWPQGFVAVDGNGRRRWSEEDRCCRHAQIEWPLFLKILFFKERDLLEGYLSVGRTEFRGGNGPSLKFRPTVYVWKQSKIHGYLIFESSLARFKNIFDKN